MRLIWIAVGLAAVVLVTFGLWGGDFERWFSGDGAVEWIRSWGALGWLAVVVLLMLDIVLPLPGTVIMSAAGYIYGALLGGLICAVGSFCSGLTAYALCRRFGRQAAEWVAGPKDLARGEVLFRRHGIWLVAVSRSLPILAEVGSCFAGLVRMPFGRFVLALALGCVPMAFIFAYIGAIGHEDARAALAFSLIVPTLLWLAVHLWYKRQGLGESREP